MNDDTPMCERHEANYIQSKGYHNRNSHDLFSRQSYYDPNDSEKSLTELNNDVKNDLEDFKRRIRSMRTVHWKLFSRDDGKTTGVLPKKESKTVNQEPQSKTDFEKSITKFLDGQRVTNMFFKNNVNDLIIKMKQNEKNCQTKIKNMERKMYEWEKSQNISLEQTDRTDPPPPPQAHTEHVNAVFTRNGKFDDSLKIQKDSPPPIIVNNKIKKDKPIKTSKRGYHVDDDVAWWVDLGATVHVCKDRCWFKTYESLNDGFILHMGNESTALVHGRGYVDVRLNIVFDNIGSAFMSTFKLNDSIIWHARRGNVHFKRMQDMSKDELISAFDTDIEKAVVRLPDPKLKTLGKRSIECIFVGYAEHSEAFRFYGIEPNDLVLINSIIESRDAFFDDNGISSVPRPSLRMSY
ncbi:hypothetical protein Tco_0613770 [Tanacetum coccineum]